MGGSKNKDLMKLNGNGNPGANWQLLPNFWCWTIMYLWSKVKSTHVAPKGPFSNGVAGHHDGGLEVHAHVVSGDFRTTFDAEQKHFYGPRWYIYHMWRQRVSFLMGLLAANVVSMGAMMMLSEGNIASFLMLNKKVLMVQGDISCTSCSRESPF